MSTHNIYFYAEIRKHVEFPSEAPRHGTSNEFIQHTVFNLITAHAPIRHSQAIK